MDEDIHIPISSWSFPPEFSPGINPTKLISGEENIKQSLQILFSTIYGERVYRPDYGFSFRELVFETNNLSTQVMIMNNIRQAVGQYEPRIRIDQIRIDNQATGEGMLSIDLEYTIIQTEIKDNLVYSFAY